MKSYYGALTGLRAIAAFMVYLHHYNPGMLLFNSILLEDICKELHVGVTIFFTLSGFLIATRYLDTANLRFTYVKKYLINRFARVYPLYFIITTCIYIYYLSSDTSSKVFYEYFLNISFLKGFSWQYLGTGIQQSWSLTVEECFYLFALFFFAALKYASRARIAVWFFFLIALPAIGLLIMHLCQRLGIPFFENIQLLVSYTFFGRFTEFFMGIGAAILLKKIPPSTRIAWFTYIGVAFFSLGIYFLFRIKYIYGESFGTHHPLGMLVNNIYLPIFISLVIIGLIREKTLFSTVLNSQLFSLLGRSSYAFYLIHMGHIHGLFSPYFDEETLTGSLLIFIVLVILSIALYKLVEEPLNKLIRSSQPSLG
ncbi:acyltransferase family protein [Hymenobacter rubripertinctus]|nr:acyltransferase [Hymenobacter rubripertinctus]